MSDGIRSVKITKNAMGEYERVKVIFGPHHFVDIFITEKGTVDFVLGATHHGFKADASVLNSQLEKIIWDIHDRYPNLAVD